MIKIESKEQCCGCTACQAICPKDAITMRPDGLGFKYPVVDSNKCIECDLCVKVCQFHPDYDKTDNFAESIAFGVRHKNINEVMSSRSGAAFVALSDFILQSGGVVYGVGFKEGFVVSHIKATNKSERDLMKGSKYVQSDLEDVFRMVKQDLRNGKQVLFSGTPCQVAGLKSYVGKKLRDNLYLVDIICHGVPSPYIWHEYLKWLQKKWNTEITKVNFRDKRFGWTKHKESYLTKTGMKYCNSFTRSFHKHLSIRDCCEKCPYANTHHPSDLTLADFWGWQKNDSNWNKDDKGLSLVLVNSEKGKSLLEKAQIDLDCRQYPLANCMQNLLHRPIFLHPRHKEFKRDFEEKGFVYAMKKFGCIGIKYEVYHICSELKAKLNELGGR